MIRLSSAPNKTEREQIIIISKEISRKMGRGRAPCCDKNQVKRGPWSPAEDLRLITFIQRYGHENWRALPKLSGTNSLSLSLSLTLCVCL